MIPKFRAWDCQNKVWVGNLFKKVFISSGQAGGALLISQSREWLGDGPGVIYTGDTQYEIEKLSIHVKFQLSTGLKDKNGQEIFEGDILKCTSTDGSFWHETVLWNETLAGFATQQKGYDAIAISYIMDSKALTVEVTGNIYENQELI